LQIGVAYKIMQFLFGPNYATPSLIAHKDSSTDIHPVDLFNDDRVRAAEVPSANVHASARALGKLAAVMAHGGELDGTRLLSKETVDLAQSDAEIDYDTVLRGVTKFTKGGLAVFDTGFGYHREGFFGWFGMGGSVLQWSPSKDIAFGYTCNLFGASLFNRNSYLVQKAVLKCVEEINEIEHHG
jgi:CubicO group peptidase (beta-lactamase class C family)